jgi:Ca-activated chloride channel family protein
MRKLLTNNIAVFIYTQLVIVVAFLVNKFYFNEITFKDPLYYLLYIPFVFLVVLDFLSEQRNYYPISSLNFFDSIKKSFKPNFLFLRPLFRYFAISFLIIALSYPEIIKEKKIERSEGIAIQLVVDISSSMDMTVGDIDKTRMEVAKRVITEFIAGNGEELKGRKNDLIGIITFARFADTICPLTFSHQALLSIAEEITINQSANEDGTAYGDATALGAARLNVLEKLRNKKDKIKSKIIILLTDGDNNCGKHLPLEAAAMAKKWGVKIYAISLSDKYNSIVGSEEEGQYVTSSLSSSDKVLFQMAHTTGGIFRKAYDYGSLMQVYDEIDKLEKSKIVAKLYKFSSPCYLFFLYLAFFAILLELLLMTTILRSYPC